MMARRTVRHTVRCFPVATLALLLVSCGSTALSRTGPTQPSRGPSCEFEMFTAVQISGYDEIGTIDVTPGWYGQKVHQRIEGFKQEIAPLACEAGADAAIALANGSGVYLKATLLKRKAQEVIAIGAEPASPPTGGCQYDTQCKGERVCVDGKCVEPEAKEPTPAPATSGETAPSAAPAK